MTVTGGSSRIPTLYGIVGHFSGNLISESAVIAQQVYVGTSVPYKNLSDSYKEIRVVQVPNSTDYKIQKKDFDDADWVDIPNTTFKSYAGGWDAAVSRLNIPRETPTTLISHIAVYYPPTTVNGAAEHTAYWLQNNGKNIVDLAARVNNTDVVVARLTHNKYDAGWGAAAGNSLLPTTTKTGNAQITISYPDTVVDSFAKTRQYTMQNNGDNITDLVTSVSGSDVVVARLTHNKYNAGWGAAAANSSLPTTTKTGNAQITISYPSTVVGSFASTRSYTMQNNGNNITDLVTSVSGSDVVVARLTHNKYNAGWGAAAANSSLPTTTKTGNAQITISYPSTVVGSFASTRSYEMTNYDDNTVDLITKVSGSNITVARFNHGKYTAGDSVGYTRGLAEGSASVTAATPQADAILDNATARDITMYSVTSTGLRSSGKSTTHEINAYWASGIAHYCVNVKYDTWIIGRYDVQDVFTEGQRNVRNNIGNYGTVSSNGTYKASDNGWEGISEITVDIAGASGVTLYSVGLVPTTAGPSVVEQYVNKGTLHKNSGNQYLMINLSNGRKYYYTLS